MASERGRTRKRVSIARYRQKRYRPVTRHVAGRHLCSQATWHQQADQLLFGQWVRRAPRGCGARNASEGRGSGKAPALRYAPYDRAR